MTRRFHLGGYNARLTVPGQYAAALTGDPTTALQIMETSESDQDTLGYYSPYVLGTINHFPAGALQPAATQDSTYLEWPIVGDDTVNNAEPSGPTWTVDISGPGVPSGPRLAPGSPLVPYARIGVRNGGPWAMALLTVDSTDVGTGTVLGRAVAVAFAPGPGGGLRFGEGTPGLYYSLGTPPSTDDLAHPDTIAVTATIGLWEISYFGHTPAGASYSHPFAIYTTGLDRLADSEYVVGYRSRGLVVSSLGAAVDGTPLTVPPLRQRQRNDLTRQRGSRNQPTSRQGSARQGWNGTYA